MFFSKSKEIVPFDHQVPLCLSHVNTRGAFHLLFAKLERFLWRMRNFLGLPGQGLVV